jgi:hypothetical protein
MKKTFTEKILYKKYIEKVKSTVGRTDKNGMLIEMKLTYEEWCNLWNDFGKLPGQPYVLSRRNDVGHYELGNVFIQHNLKNITDASYNDDEYQHKITDYCIETGYKRSIVRRLIKNGHLKL